MGLPATTTPDVEVWGPAKGFSAFLSEVLESEEGAEVTPKVAEYSRNDFRSKFIQKLAYKKVWVPPEQRQARHQTVIIFDWDDTLLCTSWLMAHERVPSESKERVLQNIAEAAKQMLEKAVASGHTFIITNAKTGWVEHSAEKWAPALLPILKQVQVISARDNHEAFFPQEVNMWKIQAFLEVQKRFDSSAITNLVVLGDADYEMTAASVMGGEFETALVKTIKFRQNPTPVEHLKQLELVYAKLDQIVAAARKMRIFLERKAS